MTLHSPIRAYFDANGATPLDAFTPDAIVADEGHRHVGHALTGQFPGSPITLTLAFRGKDERIAALESGS